jgi:hypothetical protein
MEPINLQSMKVLGSLADPTSGVKTSDVIGLAGGALLGWFLAKKFPNFVVKGVGVLAGAELGIIIARLIAGLRTKTETTTNTTTL